jgi:xanthine phosphoribosyltransferase
MMDLLKKRIIEEGRTIGEEIVKVDSFLNHQIDVELFLAMGKEFRRLFDSKKITKLLTIEASGIAIASIAALEFKVPVVFAKKSQSRNLDKEIYTSKVYSFTKQMTYDVMVSKRYLSSDDHVLILDDFLANGKAALGLIDIARQAGATIEGVGIVIEKGFQPGGKILRDQGIKVESLAIIDRIKDGQISFLN